MKFHYLLAPLAFLICAADANATECTSTVASVVCDKVGGTCKEAVSMCKQSTVKLHVACPNSFVNTTKVGDRRTSTHSTGNKQVLLKYSNRRSSRQDVPVAVACK